MKCSKCNEELNPKWKLCPFCGTQVPLTAKPFNEYLAELVKSNTSAIFKEENGTRLEKIMSEWPESYADNRDIIKLLMIKKIPSKLCSALEESDNEKNKVVQDSANVLIDKFGINSETASKMISLITNAIGLKATVAVGNGMGTFRDPRDGQVYKTCKIGDQVWLAENLKYDCGKDCLVYNKDYQHLDKYGYMYYKRALSKAIPEGWHIPTRKEVEAMLKYIVKTNRCKSAFSYLISKDWDYEEKHKASRSYTDSDYYGFSALPGGYSSPVFIGGIKSQGMGSESRWWMKDASYLSISSYPEPSIQISRTSNDYLFYIRLIKD